jgi:hypothetical protein
MKHFEIRHEDEWCEVIQHSTTTHIKIDVDQLYNGYYRDGFMEFAIERIRDILGSDRVSTKNVLRAIEETDYRISDLAKDCADNFIYNIVAHLKLKLGFVFIFIHLLFFYLKHNLIKKIKSY